VPATITGPLTAELTYTSRGFGAFTDSISVEPEEARSAPRTQPGPDDL
jgi:hypothetical protein